MSGDGRPYWIARRGIFFDCDFEAAKRSTYEYATTFYPLWAGWATAPQAAAVRKSVKKLERSGGIMTSSYVTGVQ